MKPDAPFPCQPLGGEGSQSPSSRRPVRVGGCCFGAWFLSLLKAFSCV